MTRHCHILTFLISWAFLSLLPDSATGTELGKQFSTVYTLRDFHAANQNWGTVQDSAGVLYFANNDGILCFDGFYWTLIPVSKDSSSVRAIATGPDGSIWAGAEDEFGKLTRLPNGKPVFTSWYRYLPDSSFRFTVVRKILISGDLVFFITPQAVLQVRDTVITIIRTKTQIQNGWLARGKVIIREKATGLAEIRNGALVPLPGGDRFGSEDVFSLLDLPGGSLLAASRTSGFWRLNPDSGTADPVFPEAGSFITENRIYNGLRLSDGKMAFPTLLGGVLILNQDGSIAEILNKQRGLRENKVYHVYEDRQGLLWMSHERGITRVEFRSPISYWDESLGLDGSIYDLIRFQGILYAATGSGLFKIPGTTAEKLDIPETQIWKLAELNGSLYAATNYGLYKLQGDKLTRVFEEPVNSLLPAGKTLFCGLRSGLKVVGPGGNRRIFPEIEDEITQLALAQDGRIWASTRLNGLIRLPEDPGAQTHSSTPVYYTSADGLPGENFLQIYSFPVGLIAATQSGLYVFQPAENRFIPAGHLFPGLPVNQSTYRLAVSPSGDFFSDTRYWLQKTPSGFLPAANDLFRRLPLMEFWAIYPEASGAVWIGGTEGLFRVQISETNLPSPAIKPLISRLSVAGRQQFYSPGSLPNPVIIPYSGKGIRFYFSCPDYITDQPLCRFRLDGFESDWSAWAPVREKEYTNLPEGRYTFEVAGLTPGGGDTLVSAVTFTILPPWYRSWYMIAVYVFLAGFAIWGVVMYRVNAYRRETEILEQRVTSRTAELQTALADLQSVQTQLVQSEKMASLGILTGGIAHEINNPVNFIRSAVPPLRQDVADLMELIRQVETVTGSEETPDRQNDAIRDLIRAGNPGELAGEIHQLLEGIESGTIRTMDIVQSLKTFSRLEENEVKKLNLNECLDSTLLLLSNLTGTRIRVETDLQPLPEMEGFPGQINQVLMNVLVNSAESIADSGTISVRTEAAGDRIRLTISDTGHGMDAKTLARIFDPFFTTRPVGKNKGLGLSIAYQILHHHGGTISVTSEPDKGTTVVLSFPIRWDEKRESR